MNTWWTWIIESSGKAILRAKVCSATTVGSGLCSFVFVCANMLSYVMHSSTCTNLYHPAHMYMHICNSWSKPVKSPEYGSSSWQVYLGWSWMLRCHSHCLWERQPVAVGCEIVLALAVWGCCGNKFERGCTFLPSLICWGCLVCILQACSWSHSALP